jgi:GxxExxY protein
VIAGEKNHEEHEGHEEMEFDILSNQVIGCAIEVHRVLGPGLLESAYERCLSHELQGNRILFIAQHPLPIEYKGLLLDCGYRVDLFIDGKLIVELKAVDRIMPVHEAQLLTYLKLAGVRTGLLISFNVTQLKSGIRRYVL